MIQFDLPKQKSSIIKVLGVGGGGSNAVNFMFQQDIEGVDFIICNTDSKAIEQSLVPNKIQLGPHLTQGLGAGADPSVGKMATEESLEEIKRILEVNTKMAFITVGMGGGTGTGGAPIIAKICKDLGILTVGIVTTPFGFEGPRRQKQAEEGINELKPFVDTLLVISNDKLRVQYGNLKMKEAFTKADNVLATAAKCITDVINSRGHIIVDFADVCTVMKNGGVAILGKAEVAGENRAERAIEEALNSPLLNDNDIKGAKWILLNINSAEGEYECSMDELEAINTILRARTGEHSDVIMGMGYDETLGEKLGITLIATGFEHKDPFKKEAVKEVEAPLEEKIVMTLQSEQTEQTEQPLQEATTAPIEPTETLEVNEPDAIETAVPEAELILEELEISVDELAPTMQEFVVPEMSNVYVSAPDYEEEVVVASFEEELISEEIVLADFNETFEEEEIAEVFELNMEEESTPVYNTEFVLNKPVNIYAEAELEIEAEAEEVEAVVESVTEVAYDITAEVVVAADTENLETSFRSVEMEMEEEPTMQLVMREESSLTPQNRPQHSSFDISMDNSEEQRRKVAERIQKLRNLSFNINNGSDPGVEFDAVPAYVRRNLDLFGNTMASVENYYSKYTVDQDENNQTQISTINSFLDGKKPD
ncbi:MAG: cell division protein FtsZ [Chitinophagaceae bacterium]|nr:cell division protein FtsZ [Chitinophagaceae bacterium]MCF8289888.1 cell division protein FtsZ [Chitinophagaceae bacterium]MCF8422201.1 cell division protein FtsZ [Chitinophagaceae bacterium]